MNTRPPLRLLIVDDHPIVRRGLAQLVRQQADMTVVAEGDTVAHALDAVAALPAPPDVAIIDLTLGAESGLTLVKALDASCPSMGILVLSMHDERLHADRALAAGARGYIMKEAAPQKLIAAIRCVAAGKTYVSDEMAARILTRMNGRHVATPPPPMEALTKREREVFGLLGQGLTTRDIADRCDLSVKTVETHLARIKDKLGLQSGHELVRTALAWSTP